MFRALISLAVIVLTLLVVIPGAVLGYLWWDGAQLLGKTEAQAWLAPKPVAAPLTTFERVASRALFADTWDETGVPCRTGARFWLNYTAGADKRGLSVSQVVARDIASRVAPGLGLHEQLRQLSIACQLENSFDDSAMLRIWLRYAWFGPGLDGADTASATVFKKAPGVLDETESAKLVALVRWPDSRGNATLWDQRAQVIAAWATR